MAETFDMNMPTVSENDIQQYLWDLADIEERMKIQMWEKMRAERYQQHGAAMGEIGHSTSSEFVYQNSLVKDCIVQE